MDFILIQDSSSKIFSNTYLLYKKGWSEINVDADKRSIDLFNKTRKRDINLKLAVSDKEGKLKFYAFKDGAINTFSDKEAKKNQPITKRSPKRIFFGNAHSKKHT